jgi:hypothetical protein
MLKWLEGIRQGARLLDEEQSIFFNQYHAYLIKAVITT